MRTKQRSFCLLALLVASYLSVLSVARAIPETDYQSTYTNTILPFRDSGERFTFYSADNKYRFSGVRFIHPRAKGVFVVINGFTESWMKYGELFYDLYQEGYSIISYDHRGQGVSPHLILDHPQVGFVDHFSDYSNDMNEFMAKIVTPMHHHRGGLFLLANSMGGAVAAEYLEDHPSTFEAVVLSSPMLEINTRPYPQFIAHAIVGSLSAIGFARRYAIGQHNADLDATFRNNTLTGSKVRWWSYGYVGKEHPDILIGGASNGWVNTSISTTSAIRKNIPKIMTRTLLLEAGKDSFVMNKPIKMASTQIPHARLISFPDARHGILMESDPIRNQALQQIESFFLEN